MLFRYIFVGIYLFRYIYIYVSILKTSFRILTVTIQ